MSSTDWRVPAGVVPRQARPAEAQVVLLGGLLLEHKRGRARAGGLVDTRARGRGQLGEEILGELHHASWVMLPAAATTMFGAV